MTFNSSNSLTVGGLNTNSGVCSTIAGGFANNIASSVSRAFIGAGNANIICSNGNCSVIGGGTLNKICGSSVSFIGGGSNNTVNACHSAILGGIHNTASDSFSVILGGETNKINTSYTGSGNNFIGIGFFNKITGSTHNNFIGGGSANTISGSNCGILPSKHNSILGGESNTICAFQNSNHNTIGGGLTNRICVYSTVYTDNGYYSANGNHIGGGSNNTISICGRAGFYYCGDGGTNFIGGGFINRICCNSQSSIVGGYVNVICCSGVHNSIVGGYNNVIRASRGSSILGGCQNKMCSNSTTLYNENQLNAIVGGRCNAIGCGDADVCYNTIGGGLCNRICCNSCYNFVAGCSNCAGAGSSTNNSQNSALFGKLNRSCGDNNFVAGCNNSTSTYNQAAILGTYGKTSTTSNQTMVCTLCVLGSLSKSSGTFTIDHPNSCKSATHNLHHSFVESPTAGDNIYRWEIDIDDTLQGEVILPEYYRYLNENSQVWINPVDNLGRAFGIVNISATKVKITTSDPGKFNILVVGTRKDKAAIKAWKGVETLKNEEEITNYKSQFK